MNNWILPEQSNNLKINKMTDNSIQSNIDLYKKSKKQLGIMNENSWKPTMKNSILNLDNYNDGTHWVSIKKNGKNNYLYDDSFGVRPAQLNLSNSLIEYDDRQEQHIKEKNCGKRAFNSLL